MDRIEWGVDQICGVARVAPRHLSAGQLQLDSLQLGFCGRHTERYRTLTEFARMLLRNLGYGRLFILHQVHGSDIIEFDAMTSAVRSLQAEVVTLGSADGIYSPKGPFDTCSDLLGVQSADCVPLLLLAREARAVVHAGWRGLERGAIKSALKLFARDQVSELCALVGPCAGPNSYEVQDDVASRFQDYPGCLRQVGERVYLNLRQVAREQLLNAAAEFNIRMIVHDSGICTMSDSNFHSFRREKRPGIVNLSYLAI